MVRNERSTPWRDTHIGERGDEGREGGHDAKGKEVTKDGGGEGEDNAYGKAALMPRGER
jgi:hypothetical protein